MTAGAIGAGDVDEAGVEIGTGAVMGVFADLRGNSAAVAAAPAATPPAATSARVTFDMIRTRRWSTTGKTTKSRLCYARELPKVVVQRQDTTTKVHSACSMPWII